MCRGAQVTTPFLALAGAVAATGPDAGTPAHYGDPFAEQRWLIAGTALVDLSHRGVLSVSGADRLSWLNSITSQALENLAPGVSSEALFLDPNGHLEHLVRVIDDGDTCWLLIEGTERETLLGWLQRMRFALRVEVRDRSEEFTVLGATDTSVLDVASSAHTPHGTGLDWIDAWATPPSGGHQYATAEPYPGASWRWVERIIPRDDRDRAAAVVASGALHPAGALAVNALRIAAWRPRLVTEVDDRTLPHELDLLRTAVNLTKGCYRGQETVAKVLNLGRPPRRLVMLHLDGSDSVLPSAGAELVAPRQRPEPEPGEPVDLIEVGRITTSGYHHELGPIALAVVKRQVPIELVLQASVGEGRISATQTEIVPVTAGSAVTVPRLPRLGVRR